MKWLLLIAAAVTVSACAANGQVRTVEVKVPTAADCVPPDLPGAPSYPDTDDTLLRAADAAERYRLLILGREVRISRLGVLEGVVGACKGAPE